MKKSLIALAVAGMFVASAASAQSSNVTLYGRINLDLETVSSSTDKGLGKSQRLQNNSSRIGVKGSEDLGGGLKAIFQIESGIAADDGSTSKANTLAGRDTYLGLQGEWGTVRFGRLTPVADDIHGIWGNAPTFTTSILSTQAIYSQNPFKAGDIGSFNSRNNNSIQYTSPSINGLQLAVQAYFLDESGAKDDNSMYYAGTAIYKNAGLQVGAGFEYADWDKNKAKDAGSDLQLVLAGGYDFGFIRPAAAVEYVKVSDSAEAAKSTKNRSANTDRMVYAVSATAPVGTGKAYAAFVYADDWDKIDDTGAWQAEISYTYPLSKMTQVYAGYVYINNDKAINYTFSTNGNKDVQKGVDQQGLIFGMIHMF